MKKLESYKTEEGKRKRSAKKTPPSRGAEAQVYKVFTIFQRSHSQGKSGMFFNVRGKSGNYFNLVPDVLSENVKVDTLSLISNLIHKDLKL